MRLSRIILAAVLAAMPAAAPGQDKPAPKSLHDVFSATRPATPPATQPSLPAGHPQLPSGHPQLPSGHPQLPAGHPDTPKMPAGHPAVPGQGMPAGHPQVQPTTMASEGTVSLRVIQGTKSGKAIVEGMPVTLELFHRGSVIRKFDAKVDKNGEVVLEKLPLMLPFQPVARMNYAGTSFTVVGEMMSPRRPAEKLELTVYEVTEQAPAWNVPDWRVVIEPARGALQVTEFLVIENPADHAWTGEAMADGSKLTFRMRIPSGIGQLNVGGLDHASTYLKDGLLGTSSPMIPGPTSLRISYTLPLKDGKGNLLLTAPADVKSLLLFLPDDGSVLEAKDMQPAPPMGEGQDKLNVFKAADVKAGHQAQIVVTPKAKQ